VPEDFRPNFMATGIGSLPHRDPLTAVADVTGRLTEMPYWPQLPALGPAEDMNLQYVAALEPLVGADLASREPKAHPGLSREEALAGLYERLFGGDTAGFTPRADQAAGFAPFCRVVAAAPAAVFPWVKGHVTGPLTQAAAVLGHDGKAMLYDDECAEAVARALGVALAAQAGQLAALGRRVMMFLDEPFLSGYGSAFTPINRQRVVDLLAACLEEARQRAPWVVIGIHCCGNTDWAMLVEAGADVLNLDSAGFGRHLLLYPEALRALFQRGGAVAWGAVPTSEYTGRETVEGLWAHTRDLLTQLEAMGFERAQLAAQAMVTPACGLGSLDEARARAILDLTAGVSALARRDYR